VRNSVFRFYPFVQNAPPQTLTHGSGGFNTGRQSAFHTDFSLDRCLLEIDDLNEQ
jgi:hypothetical protein